MIVKPRLTSLLDKVDSRYTLVSVVAKRARQLTEGEKEMIHSKNTSKVSIAAEELDEDKFDYKKSDEE